ncbi:MAG: glycosyltransferase family 2 protein [Sporocytophaga sp.]|uniref:glycosyltransferase n=1 Tax=Sporocytophaga sp. TaxID=2231183 RepID=UPI001B21DF18|nr:glycosyltransferase [Sporocytophaga sp.]MBO9702736.1 glycosyltransferase family 2 protein [Sporocytophaga sp.]
MNYFYGFMGFLCLLMFLFPVFYYLQKGLLSKQYFSLVLFLLAGVFIFSEIGVSIISIILSAVIVINVLFYTFFSIRGLKKKKILNDPFTFEPSVSIVIAAKDEGNVIGDTLRSLCEIDYPRDNFNIVVIDDGSSDNTCFEVEELRKVFPNIILESNESSKGKAWSINSVISRLDSEFILILDADHLVDENILRNMVKSFEYEDVSCVQSASLVRNGSVNLLTKMLELEYIFRCKSIYPGKSIGIFVGSGGMFRRVDLIDLGGFNTEMLTEDVELSYRIYKSGKRIAYNCDITTFELATPDYKNFYNQRYRWMRGLWSAMFRHLFHKDSYMLDFRTKVQFIQFTLDGFVVFCFCLLQVYFFLGLIELITFKMQWPIFILSLNCIFTFGIGFWRVSKWSNFNYLILFSFYMIAHTYPFMMALIDSYLLKKPEVWIKTDRSVLVK